MLASYLGPPVLIVFQVVPPAMSEFIRNVIFCPGCKEVHNSECFECLGLIEERGNIPRFQCKICGRIFETLPPSFANYQKPTE